MKQAWCLAAASSEATAKGLPTTTAVGWGIEASLRDTKDLRFGMGDTGKGSTRASRWKARGGMGSVPMSSRRAAIVLSDFGSGVVTLCIYDGSRKARHTLYPIRPSRTRTAGAASKPRICGASLEFGRPQGRTTAATATQAGLARSATLGFLRLVRLLSLRRRQIGIIRNFLGSASLASSVMRRSAASKGAARERGSGHPSRRGSGGRGWEVPRHNGLETTRP
jgi:hypothetical protein